MSKQSKHTVHASGLMLTKIMTV